MSFSARAQAAANFARGFANLRRDKYPHSGDYLFALYFIGTGTANEVLKKSLGSSESRINKFVRLCASPLSKKDRKEDIFLESKKRKEPKEMSRKFKDEVLGTGHLLFYLITRRSRASRILQIMKFNKRSLLRSLARAEARYKGTEGLLEVIGKALSPRFSKNKDR